MKKTKRSKSARIAKSYKPNYVMVTGLGFLGIFALGKGFEYYNSNLYMVGSYEKVLTTWFLLGGLLLIFIALMHYLGKLKI